MPLINSEDLLFGVSVVDEYSICVDFLGDNTDKFVNRDAMGIVRSAHTIGQALAQVCIDNAATLKTELALEAWLDIIHETALGVIHKEK